MSAAAVATAMRERPILFSGPMVRAILAGTKTQTRRVVVGIRGPNPPGLLDVYRLKGPGAGWCGAFKPGDDQKRSGFVQTECPYGRPGDRLWVRETWPTSRSLREGVGREINGKRAPWVSNPWCWAITFKRLA